MIKWDFYTKRRKVNLVKYIIRNNIESYEHLVDVLTSKGVEPPEKALFQAAYAIALPPVQKVQKTVQEKKPAQRKKTTAKRKTSTTKRRTKKTSG